jgi:hypothetical protein
MIQPDSIKFLTDTTTSLSDSLVKVDSLAASDSLRLVDSLKSIVQIPRGFIGMPHPSLPQTESWVFVILLTLFFLLIYSIARSYGLISDTIKTFFQVKERSSIFSNAAVNYSGFRILIILYAIGVLSFYVYLVMHKSNLPFSIKEYVFFLLVTGLFFVFKLLIFELIGYIFLTPVILKMLKDSYFNVVLFLSVVLFPLVFIQIYILDNFTQIIEIIGIFLILIAFILILIKLFQIFFRNILAIFYILLYLCTLEILPLIFLFKVYQLIV